MQGKAGQVDWMLDGRRIGIRAAGPLRKLVLEALLSLAQKVEPCPKCNAKTPFGRCVDCRNEEIEYSLFRPWI